MTKVNKFIVFKFRLAPRVLGIEKTREQVNKKTDLKGSSQDKEISVETKQSGNLDKNVINNVIGGAPPSTPLLSRVISEDKLDSFTETFDDTSYQSFGGDVAFMFLK